MNNTNKMLQIETIRIDGGTQARAKINVAKVSEYAEAVQDGAVFPRVIVFFDGANNWLAEGFHRYHAHKKAGKTEMDAEIRSGTVRDAILYSVSANATHGLNRSNDDKRKAVGMLLADKEWSTWSDSEIARRCCVSNKTVTAVRNESSLGKSQVTPQTTVTEGDAENAVTAPVATRTYTSKSGKVSTMKVGKIGKGAGKGAGKPGKSTPPVQEGPKPGEVDEETGEELAQKPEEPEMTEVERLHDELDVTTSMLEQTMEENASYKRIVEANDQVVAAMQEVTMARAQMRGMKARMNSLIGEVNQHKDQATMWMNKFKKLEKAVAAEGRHANAAP